MLPNRSTHHIYGYHVWHLRIPMMIRILLKMQNFYYCPGENRRIHQLLYFNEFYESFKPEYGSYSSILKLGYSIVFQKAFLNDKFNKLKARGKNDAKRNHVSFT